MFVPASREVHSLGIAFDNAVGRLIAARKKLGQSNEEYEKAHFLSVVMKEREAIKELKRQIDDSTKGI